MIISIHIGAHATNGPALMRGLLKNKARLSEYGVCVPDPAVAQPLILDAMKAGKATPATKQAQRALIDHLTQGKPCQRLVLSDENIICHAQGIFADSALYAKARFRLAWLRNVFADHRVEFVLGLRNPASFVPAAFAQDHSNRGYAAFIGDLDLDHLRWSRLIATIRTICPDVALKVYAFEDTPVIWGRLIRRIADVNGSVPLAGALDMIATLMKPEGITRLRSYLETHKPKTEIQFQRILGAFLEKYADPAQMEEEIDLPDWDDALIERLSTTYDDDLYLIEGLKGVEFIT
ncbi:hypothetical protein [Celeribacter marinus]|uniref:hypothetical protein n=1 Tax=Celeribacter marinus TaxID=1397108 RepID=UPI003F6AB790